VSKHRSLQWFVGCFLFSAHFPCRICVCACVCVCVFACMCAFAFLVIFFFNLPLSTLFLTSFSNERSTTERQNLSSFSHYFKLYFVSCLGTSWPQLSYSLKLLLLLLLLLLFYINKTVNAVTGNAEHLGPHIRGSRACLYVGEHS